MTESIDALRTHLASREAHLAKLRERLKAAKAEAERPVQSTISDIQRRYLSAVADLETKRVEPAAPIIHADGGVSSLAKRWSKGIDGVKIERSRISVRGDVTGAKKTFSNKDMLGKSKSSHSKSNEPQPAELLVEDDSGVPSWAKNQRKLVIRKENARSSIRDVDVRELQGSVLEQASRPLAEGKGETVIPGGNVKAALAMWGKTAEEDAKVLAEKKKEEDRKEAERLRLQKQREEEERRTAIRKAVEKFSKMGLADLKEEPQNDVELTAFLERKIELVDKEISDTEDELDKLEN